MKNFKLWVMAFIALSMVTCNQKTEKSETPKSVETENFDWLIGNWKRVNEEKGKETFENWIKTTETEYVGIGFTMQNADTISQEKMTIVKQNNKWNVIVKVPNETVTFAMSSFDKNSFTCINKANEFPKEIKYWKDESKLKATIAADSIKIDFEFEKVNK